MNKQHPDHSGQWFIFKGEQHRGPYQTDEMVNLFSLGVIGHRDLVWREGGGTWLPFADQPVFKELIFKEENEPEERPPVDVPIDIPVTEVTEPIIIESPPELPPVPDEVELAMANEIEPPAVVEESETEFTPPEIPDISVEPEPMSARNFEEEIDKTSPSLSFEDGVLEDDVPSFSWGKLVAGVFFVVALIASGLWFTQFRLQTYDLIGLETADIKQFNDVLLDRKADHIIRVTTDGNVIWAAVPGIIEGEAYLKVSSKNGRVLSTEELIVTSQGEMVQGLVPFKKFEFESGEQWVRGEYTYQLAVRPKGTVARLASLFAPYPWLNKFNWVNIHSRGHTYVGELNRYEGSANKFSNDLAIFKEKIWDSLSKPLQNRLEKYQTLKQLAVKTRELWFGRLDVAVTWRAFKRYDSGYAKNVAPVLQDLIVDSIRVATATKEESPLVSRLFEEVAGSGKQLGELASMMSKESKAVRQYRKKDKERLRTKFEVMWKPLINQIDEKIGALQSEYNQLKANYNSNK